MGQEGVRSREEREIEALAQRFVSAEQFLENKTSGAPSGDPALRRRVRDLIASARPMHRGG